jgi:RNA polymerase sigma-70 factor, ECF subfamily
MLPLPDTRASMLVRVQNPADAVAWEEFVDLYRPVIAKVAIGRGLQSSDVENVIQEVLMRVARAIGPWMEREQRSRFRPWLRCIARNESVNLLTRRQTRPLSTNREGTSLSEIPDDTGRM